MKRYLDPKADLIFKKVFGQHQHLVKSLLNAMLPLEPDQMIESIEYLPTELVPEIPMDKNSIVDVRCKDNKGRQFIVEMQMLWTDSFKYRVLFNASKAFVRQMGKRVEYELLQPVYALSFVNQIFEKDTEEYYHHYRLVHQNDTKKVIDGLQMIFIELPKFKPTTMSGKKMQALWLRFLTEIDEETEHVDAALLESPEIKEAIDYAEESAFSKVELELYDRLWDAVYKEKTFYADAERKGLAKGMEKGMEKGKAEVALNLKQSGMPVDTISKMTGLPQSEIEKL